jgi:hypothetical protein
MSHRIVGTFPIICLLAAIGLLGGAGSAAAAGVTEGNFESGTLRAWSAGSFNSRNIWQAEPRQDAEEDFEVTLPPEVGPYVAATSYGGTDTSYLSQAIELPAGSNLKLSLYLFYESSSPMAIPDPDTLFVKEGGGEATNQQVRVDVLRPNSPLESLSPNDILATLYASPSGGPERLAPTLVSADLTQFAGQTVLLRVANAVADGEMTVGAGGVSLAASPIPPPITEPIGASAGQLTTGRLFLNRGAGNGRLTVTLPAAGHLTVSDARRQVAVASSFAARRATAKPKPILIRTESVQTVGPQSVRVPIRPTAAAKKLLAKNGKLPFRLQLTFVPTSGAVATEIYKGTLLERVKPARR